MANESPKEQLQVNPIGTASTANLYFKSSQEVLRFSEPEYLLDGFKFGTWVNNSHSLSIIEMAYRARRGDQSAIAVLTAFKVTINADGKQYWPIPQATAAELNEWVRKWDSGEIKPTDPGWEDAPHAVIKRKPVDP